MRSRFLVSLSEGLHLRHLIPILITGIVLGIYEVFFAISLVSLVFSGPLEPYLSIGIGIGLVTITVLFIGIGLLSSVSGTLSSVQDTTTVILALIASSLATKLAGIEILPTVLIALALASLLTGLFLLALGLLKLGGLIRYIPYPVVGGFLAGTGWLLVQGTFSTLTGFSLTLGNLPELLSAANLVLWVPGVIFGLTFAFVMRKIRSPIIMPGLLLAGIIFFYLMLALTNTSIQEARELGLLLGESSSFTWQPLNFNILRAANWQAILNQWPNFTVLLGITLVGLLLNLSALEVEIRREYDINRELLATGTTLSVVGMLGGVVGYHGLGITRLARDMQALKRMTAILGGLVGLLILVFGATLLTFFPMPVVGGLLFFLGVLSRKGRALPMGLIRLVKGGFLRRVRTINGGIAGEAAAQALQ